MKEKVISKARFITLIITVFIAMPTLLSNINISFAGEQDVIAITKFDLLWGGNCHYQIQNNTSHTITIISFKLTEDIDVIDNEYTPPLAIPPHEDRSALYGDPGIEKICSDEGQQYLLNAVITYRVDGKRKTLKRTLKGACTKL